MSRRWLGRAFPIPILTGDAQLNEDVPQDRGIGLPVNANHFAVAKRLPES